MQDYVHRQELGRAIISYVLGRLNTLRGGDVSFVQIGANDGVREDFIHPWQAVAGWSGAVIEPVPYLFDRLCANYAAFPKVKPINCLVGKERGTAPFYYFNPGSGMGEFIGSLDKEVVLRHGVFFENIERDLQTVMLDMVPVSDLTTVTGMKRIDLIVTDTEGYDLHLLKAFDFDAMSPLVYILESKHVGTHDLMDANEAMIRRGYSVVPAFEDTIYVGSDVVAAAARDRFFQRVLKGADALFG